MLERKIVKTVYDTVDGQTFESRDEAEMHEQSLLEKFDIRQLVKCIGNYCNARECKECPFCKDNSCSLGKGKQTERNEVCIMKNYYFNNRLEVLDENGINNCEDVYYIVVNDVEEFKTFCEKVEMMDEGVMSTGIYYFDGDYGEWKEFNLRVYNTLIKYMK